MIVIDEGRERERERERERGGLHGLRLSDSGIGGPCVIVADARSPLLAGSNFLEAIPDADSIHADRCCTLRELVLASFASRVSSLRIVFEFCARKPRRGCSEMRATAASRSVV